MINCVIGGIILTIIQTIFVVISVSVSGEQKDAKSLSKTYFMWTMFNIVSITALVKLGYLGL